MSGKHQDAIFFVVGLAAIAAAVGLFFGWRVGLGTLFLLFGAVLALGALLSRSKQP